MELFEAPSEEQSLRMHQDLARDNGQKSKEDIQQAVHSIRHWLSKQRHLPQHIDDIGLERFLYGCKFSKERTKLLLERYYTARATIPELFKDRDPQGKALQNNFDACYYFPLPGYTDSGYRVSLFRLREPTNPERFNLQDSAKRVLMTMDIRLLTESCLNNITVFDLAGFTIQHYAKCTPTLTSTRRAQMAIQDAFPMRLAQVHYINVPKALEKTFSLALPLFKPKLVNKFYFHSEGPEALYDYLPRKILPRDYGGDAPSLEELNEAWREKFVSYRSWFLEESRKGFTDESKRIDGKNKFSCDLDFATSGSFQKLSID